MLAALVPAQAMPGASRPHAEEPPQATSRSTFPPFETLPDQVRGRSREVDWIPAFLPSPISKPFLVCAPTLKRFWLRAGRRRYDGDGEPLQHRHPRACPGGPIVQSARNRRAQLDARTACARASEAGPGCPGMTKTWTSHKIVRRHSGGSRKSRATSTAPAALDPGFRRGDNEEEAREDCHDQGA